jgi:4-amino-4-deoxy-L-arabinose transferase-like glycosyltransferase
VEVLVPLMVAALVGVPAVLLSASKLEPKQRRFLLVILFSAFALRITLAAIFEAIPATRVFHEDAPGYEFVGQYIATHWMGEAPPFRPPERNYGFYYVLAAFYYLFGRYRMNATVFNSIVGTLGITVVFRIALHFFHEAIARRAALFSAFFPSMIIWSAIALKDCVVTFLVLVAVLFCIRLRKRFSIANVIGTVLPIIAVYPLRFYMVYFLLAALAGTLALNRPGRIFAGVSKQLLLVGGLLAVVTVFGLTSSASADFNMMTLDNASAYRQGMAISANSSFAKDVDVSTPTGAILFLPLGITMMLWSPLPWQMVSLRPLLALPEMLVWWALAPALLRGAVFAIRHRFSEHLPIIVFTAILLIGYGLTMGNVGAAFRMRSQVLNLLFLFVAYGQYLKIAKRKGIDPAILVR